jgi:hypothetical protein
MVSLYALARRKARAGDSNPVSLSRAGRYPGLSLRTIVCFVNILIYNGFFEHPNARRNFTLLSSLRQGKSRPGNRNDGSPQRSNLSHAQSECNHIGT